MLKQTVQILTSYPDTKEFCVMGNEAVARGAIEAGVSGVFSYPGTPSTEISEVFNVISEFQCNPRHQQQYPEQTARKIYFEYSINEKIALEKAIAYSIGNKSALCVMKNVGMNVASDALMSITYQTIIAPLVVVVCDDPGCYSSSNEQDSRYWGRMASVPVFNPATPDDACRMTKEAFALSATLRLPVLVRMTTRVDHTRGMVPYHGITAAETQAHFERMPQLINIPARTAGAHKLLLEKLESSVFVPFFEKNNLDISPAAESEAGIIASGVATVYAREILSAAPQSRRPGLLNIGLLYPFPKKDILSFLKKGYKKILILEELDPFVEEEVRLLAQKNKITVEIAGKDFGGLSVTGEYTLGIVRKALEEFTGLSLQKKNTGMLPEAIKRTENLPLRPPALCAGCPHRATFYALKLAVPRDNGQIILCGDIGCFGLGALDPLRMIDTINHMGMSVSMAQGLSEALHYKPKEGKMVALLGDGTFFHSGVASLINAIYTRSNITVIIFDNRIIGMTGHQDNPGAVHHEKYKQIDIETMVKGMGADYVSSFNPFDLRTIYPIIKEAIDHEGVSVLIAKSPCIFLPEFKEGALIRKSLKVDPGKCNTCFNHCDLSIACSRIQSGKNSLVRAKAKITAQEHIFGHEQLCPANICNHGFFNSILTGSYKEALEIVRDKMLFARVCGELCHKPCESVFRTGNSTSVPIKQLKNFVSHITENFNDFSGVIAKAGKAVKKNKKVAIAGAGPAGLSAAYDLVQAGYDVTVFEKQDVPGGMIRFVIPDFRMDKNGYDKEIVVLGAMGVTFKYNVAIGKDVTLDTLSAQYDAVIVATGMWHSPSLPLVEKNVPADKRVDAITFLKDYNEGKLSAKPPATILVIGGGNSAMDAARAAKKLHAKNKVMVSCIESRNNMPAFAEEVMEAEQEGVEIVAHSVAEKIIIRNGLPEVVLSEADTKKMLKKVVCDYVITAIGQRGDQEIIAQTEGLAMDAHSRIQTLQGEAYTGCKNIFVAGDAGTGNHISLIGAIGSGKRAAVSVRKKLEHYAFEYEGTFALTTLAHTSLVPRPSGSAAAGKTTGHVPLEENEVRAAVEAFDLYQPCAKCDHCIENFGCPAMVKVNGKVVIDDKRCTRCGLCVDVCPNGAVYWVEEEVKI